MNTVFIDTNHLPDDTAGTTKRHTELKNVDIQLAARMCAAHGVRDEHGDVATASLLEAWIERSREKDWVPVRGEPSAPATS